MYDRVRTARAPASDHTAAESGSRSHGGNRIVYSATLTMWDANPRQTSDGPRRIGARQPSVLSARSTGQPHGDSLESMRENNRCADGTGSGWGFHSRRRIHRVSHNGRRGFLVGANTGGRMISVEGVTKRYGSIVAVDKATFDVDRGEVVGFLGPNGAGKTTTMRMLTGDAPARRGHDSLRRRADRRQPHGGEDTRGVPARSEPALRRHAGVRVPRVRRPAARPRRRGSSRGNRQGGRGDRAGRRLFQAHQRDLEGVPPTDGHGRGDPSRARDPGARRAHRRARPQPTRRDP